MSYHNNNEELKLDDKMESLAVLNGIANIYTRRQLYDSAIAYYRYALDTLSERFHGRRFLAKARLCDHVIQTALMHIPMLDKADMYLKRKKGSDIAEADPLV